MTPRKPSAVRNALRRSHAPAAELASARVPAAEYVRMSDEGQQYSIENQKAAIQEYADQKGFSVVKTYADAGRSGVVLNRRTALRALLQDVMSGKAGYKAILVYDVSRWGRFPNNDEAAHYEFLCTSSGVPLHYCAEPFANDETPSNSILKALKRTMAAEFSRELGDKVFRGKSRLVQLGFWVGGMPGYGYRRMMVSADGKPKQQLKFGERKSLTTDRVILVPGPRAELECVRHMFSMVLEGHHGCTSIARDLNRRGLPVNERQWTNVDIRNIVTNPKYAGWNVWHRGTQRLRSNRRPVASECWITKPGAFAPIIDQGTFDRVQAILPRRIDMMWTDKEILSRLKRLLKAKGRLSESLIRGAGGMPSTSTLHRRFGSYKQIYEKVGYHFSDEDIFRGEQAERTIRLRRKIVHKITELFPGKIVASHLPKRSRSILQLNGVTIALLLCRFRTSGEPPHWVVEPCVAERDFITLLCKLNSARDRVHSYYLFPHMNLKSHKSRKGDPWLDEGVKLKDLSELQAAVEVMGGTKVRDRRTQTKMAVARKHLTSGSFSARTGSGSARWEQYAGENPHRERYGRTR